MLNYVEESCFEVTFFFKFLCMPDHVCKMVYKHVWDCFVSEMILFMFPVFLFVILEKNEFVNTLWMNNIKTWWKQRNKNQPKSRMFIIISFGNNNCKSNVNHVLLLLLKGLALFYIQTLLGKWLAISHSFEKQNK